VGRVSRIDWVISSCRLLAEIGDEFDRTRPFADVTIGTGIHLEPKTVALLLVLARGGADVVSTGNLNSTQPEAVEYLRAHGIRVIGGPTADPTEHDGFLRQVIDARPDLILDNGGDLFSRWLEDPYPSLRGGTEETTSGRARLVPLRERLARPILVINDSPIKQFAENEHAVGQSVLESFIRITNRSTNGKQVTVFGYGACGRGVARNFAAARARVSVVEVDPVLRLKAHLDGFAVPDRDAAIAGAEVIVTVTGAPNVIGAQDAGLFRDEAILLNGGHLPWEIDVDGLREGGDAIAATDGIETFQLENGRHVHVLTGGHMVNLAGPRPLGNSVESMDIGFALQARCLEAIALGQVDAAACVVPVPRAVDEAVAAAFVSLR
jgi:adenosylhomocysteinase